MKTAAPLWENLHGRFWRARPEKRSDRNEKSTKRTSTQYKNIYYNEATKRYDVKYNFTEYSVKEGKNVYRSRWAYNNVTLSDARRKLAELRTHGVKEERGDLTLRGAFELWKTKALSQSFSPVTIENTAHFMAAIYRFIPADTFLKQIDEDVYYRLCADMRAAGYSEETLFSLNATFRKIINYSYKRRFLSENFLSCADNLKTRPKREHRLLTKREFELLDGYFKERNQSYRFLIHLLYYTGIRISEALAVTYDDFEETGRDRQLDCGAPQGAVSGMRIKITKAYISGMKLEKDTKNHKSRAIPLSSAPAALYRPLRAEHLRGGGSADDKLFPIAYQTVDSALKRACGRVGIPPISCHDFRHTFISNLIKKNIPLSVLEKVTGDTQATILRRYSHAFGNDEAMILNALEEL